MPHQIAQESKVTRVLAATAAGTTNVNGNTIDMQGYDGVKFIVAFGAIVSGAITSVKVQQGNNSNMSDAADLAASNVNVLDTDDNKLAIIDVYRPQKRYVRCVVVRGTQNATIDSATAHQYNPRVKPTTADSSTVIGTKILQSPAEGTA